MSLADWTAHFAAVDAMNAQRRAANAADNAAEWEAYAQRLENSVQSLEKELKRIVEANAGNLAEKVALRNALKKYMPIHPLIADFVNPTPANVHRGKFMRDMVHKEAVKVFHATNSWDTVRELADRMTFGEEKLLNKPNNQSN